MHDDDRRPAEVPAQHQDEQPGIEKEMEPRPSYEAPGRRGSGRLEGRVALITGGDSGIGRAVSVLFAREGADVAIVYLNEQEDAEETRRAVEEEGARCLLLQGDVREAEFCRHAVEQTLRELGKLNVLVNNAAVQFVQERPEDISDEQLENTFRTNIFAQFYLVRAALLHMREGDAIVNTASVTAFYGNKTLIDYASTKGAIVAFTRALAANIAERGIRVNAVAPGPVWTPLIPASFDTDHVAEFGQDTLLGRPGQPEEIAPSYLFLASADSSYMSGEVLHPDGGERVAR